MNTVYTHNIASDIVEEFEMLLEEKGIVVPDEDRQGNDGEACLYGGTYSELLDNVEFHIIQLLEELKKHPYNPALGEEPEDSLEDFEIEKFSYGDDWIVR